MRKIRKMFGLLAFATIIGATQACVESPTSPEGDPSSQPSCTWINGILYCED